MSYTIRTQIEIAAPKQRIWDILVDLDRYHEWNPFITDARGQIAPGATFEVRPRTARGNRHVFVPRVTTYRKHRAFTWTGAFYSRWIALGDHSFRLTELEGGCVRVDHDERIYGFAGGLVHFLMKEQIRTGFAAMNAALKARAEAIGSAVAAGGG